MRIIPNQHFFWGFMTLFYQFIPCSDHIFRQGAGCKMPPTTDPVEFSRGRAGGNAAGTVNAGAVSRSHWP